jgi:hypothetical protein
MSRVSIDWNNPIKCPVCGYEFTHFESPKEFSSDSYDAPIWGKLGGRGNILIIPMWCEQDHLFIKAFGYHKGNSYEFTKEITDLEHMFSFFPGYIENRLDSCKAASHGI